MTAKPLAVALWLCLLFYPEPSVAAARDLASMNGEEIKLLQQRLTDAGCYKGAIDATTSAGLEAAKKACPDQDPILRIETGMHVAEFVFISVDAQCRIAATASWDKTVRLWSMPDGKAIRTQRLPIGDDDDGKLFAVTVSPDGKLVAAAGSDPHYAVDAKHGAYLFDVASGASIRRIGAFDFAVLSLAYSPDGQRLAVSLFKSGIRVLDVATGAELMADRDFSDVSHVVAFGRDGTLYAGGDDGFLRRYGTDLKRTAKLGTPGGKRVRSVAVEPSGRRVAVGYRDTHAVDLLDANDLRSVGSAETADIAGSLASVSWSRDGTRLLGGSTYQKSGRMLVRSWTPDGKRTGPDVAVSRSTIFTLAACGDAIAFAATDPSFGLLKPNGEAVTLASGHSADMRDKVGSAFAVSADGRRLRFGLGPGGNRPVFFNLSGATLADAPAAQPELTAARLAGLDIKDWQNTTRPTLSGKAIAIAPYEISRSLAVRSDKSGFVLGTESSFRAFDAAGKQRWRRSIPGPAWGVNLAKDDAVIVAAYGDGTIRWQRWSDGQDLLALFVDKINKHWVAWTPTGYYMASPGGEDLIGWQLNRGWEQRADFFPASRFRERFNRPDIVRLVLDTLDEGEAVKRANEAAKRGAITQPLVASLPPVVTLLSPAAGAHFSGGEVTVEYRLRSPSGLPIDRVDTFVDGRAVQKRGLERVSGAEADRRSLTIPVPPHDVEIGLLARSGELIGDIAHMRLVYDGAKPATADLLKPKLYALIVGVSNYADPALKLGFAAEDARGFAATLSAQKGRLYSDVVVKLVTDAAATSLGVKQGLVWLGKQATSRDLAIVYLAGHGITDAKGKFWFLTHEADLSSLLTTAVSRDELVDVLFDLPGKKALFLDACHSGAALSLGARGVQTDLNSAVNDFVTAESGLVAFAASTGREFSIEREEWHHGAFTKALIEAIGEGKAKYGTAAEITTASLDAFISQRVKELTNGTQHPVMNRPQLLPDFPIALARR